MHITAVYLVHLVHRLGKRCPVQFLVGVPFTPLRVAVCDHIDRARSHRKGCITVHFCSRPWGGGGEEGRHSGFSL